MSDPNKDWLEAELENLGNLEAPPTVLPNVMEKVRVRAKGAWWVRLVTFRIEILRSFMLGISLVMLLLLVVIDPTQFFAHVPGASVLFNLIPLLFDAAKGTLLQAKIFHFSVLGLLAPAIVLSYVLLVATASVIRHLANARK